MKREKAAREFADEMRSAGLALRRVDCPDAEGYRLRAAYVLPRIRVGRGRYDRALTRLDDRISRCWARRHADWIAGTGIFAK